MCTFVTKQYNLVSAKGQWCSSAEKITAGLAESYCSLPLGLWLSRLRTVTKSPPKRPESASRTTFVNRVVRILYFLCFHHRWKKRCRRHTVFGSVRPWVSAWVFKSVRPENFVNTISQRPMKRIYLISVTDVFRFVDMLISFWDQRSKSWSQQAMTMMYWRKTASS